MVRNKWSVGRDGEGPGWYDVDVALGELRDFCGDRVELVLEHAASVRGAWGLRVYCRVGATGRELGAIGYGRAYPDGPKNMASAVYACLVKSLGEYETVLRTDDAH